MLVLKCIQEHCPCYSHEWTGNPKIDPDCQWINWCNKLIAQPGYSADKCPMDEGPIYYDDDHINQYFNPEPPECCPNCKDCYFEAHMKKVRRNKHRRDNLKKKKEELERIRIKEQNRINRNYR
jgi:hypothetical protein